MDEYGCDPVGNWFNTIPTFPAGHLPKGQRKEGEVVLSGHIGRGKSSKNTKNNSVGSRVSHFAIASRAEPGGWRGKVVVKVGLLTHNMDGLLIQLRRWS